MATPKINLDNYYPNTSAASLLGGTAHVAGRPYSPGTVDLNIGEPATGGLFSSVTDAFSGWGGAGLAFGVAGALSSAFGSYFGASAQKAVLRSQANIQDINARLSEQSAQYELQKGEKKEQASRMATANIKSSQRVSMAASGMDLGSASAVELLTSTDVMGELDAQQIQKDAIYNAWGYRTQGVGYSSDANMKRAVASGVSPYGSAANSLLSGAGQVAQTWYFMKRMSS